MKIAIIGTRGIPNQYGGFEQFAEYIAPALVRRGHDVTVYNSSLHSYKGKEWNGVHLITKFDPENKLGATGQFIYDLLCIWDSRKKNYDIILQLGYTSSSIWTFLFPRQTCLITNMDGLEWKRSKYSRPIRWFLVHAEKWAAVYSDRLIADSKGIQQYLLTKYGKTSVFIPYGANPFSQPVEAALTAFGLRPYQYHLLIARMEPENNVETIIQGIRMADRTQPLLVIGNHSNKFGQYLRNKYGSDQVRFLGGIYDMDQLNQLRYFSQLYFHGHSVGGTNPSLLEAMAAKCLIVAHDNVFNRSILEDDAFYFSQARDIAELLGQNPVKTEYWHYIVNNNKKIDQQYSWAAITHLLETHLLEAIHDPA